MSKTLLLLCFLVVANGLSAACTETDTFTVSEAPAYAEKQTLLTIKITCLKETAKDFYLTLNDLKIGSFVAAGSSSASFRLIDTGDFAAAWAVLGSVAQPVTATLRISNGKIALPKANPPTLKLYAKPAIVSVEPGAENARKNGTFRVRVANAADWLKTRTADEKIAFLYFDGHPVGFETKRADSTYDFKLASRAEVVADTRRLTVGWRDLVLRRDDSLTAYIGLGPLSRMDLPSSHKWTLELVDSRVRTAWFLCFGVFLIVFGIIVAYYDLLAESWSTAPRGKRVQSLARWQMAWWFLITFGAVTAYYSFMGDTLEIPENLIILMGISAGAGFTAMLVDDTKAAPAVDTTAPSKGIVTDLLVSNGTLSLQRLQMIVWTIVLGLIYIWEFKNTLTLPNPSAQWLGLMGLVSGIYVGFKKGESK